MYPKISKKHIDIQIFDRKYHDMSLVTIKRWQRLLQELQIALKKTNFI